MSLFKKNLLLTCLFATTYGLAGCGEAPKPEPAPVKSAHDDHDHKDGEHHEGDGHDHAKKDHDHSGWWCDEHGVPEGECGQCNSKIAAEFKKKGDWCKEHDRPDSQCQWNGTLLTCWEVVLERAQRMTWKGEHPDISRLEGHSANGVIVPKSEMKAYAARLERSKTLPKYDIIIRPLSATPSVN